MFPKMVAPSWDDAVEITQLETDKVVLIDADRYKHLTTYRIFQRMGDEGIESSKELVHEVLESYLRTDIFGAIKAKAYVFCFSAPSKMVFRNAIAQEKKYKGHREKTNDPNYYENKYDDMREVYSYISKRYQTIMFDDLEADDLLSMMQTDDTFIFSHDKDLKQVPGWHFDMQNNRLDYTTEEEGFRLLMYQVLKGDSTDNFGGLKGFGDKALETLKIEYEDSPCEALFYQAMKLYIDKHGLMNGIDTFAEMWQIASMKIKRGNYFQEKYAKAFTLIENLTSYEQK